MKQFIQQTLEQLRSQRMLTTVSIVGTALSIFLIMVVVMLQQVQVAPFAPESNRDRMLYAMYASIYGNDREDFQSNGPLSYKTAHMLFDDLEGIEAISIQLSGPDAAGIKVAGRPAQGTYVMPASEGFWQVYDFTFLNGKPFTKADVESAIPVAVIDASTARSLFGTIEAEGREFQLNNAPFRVAGVVRDVSKLATKAFANVWIPATVSDRIDMTWNTIMGGFSVVLLARSRDDFDAVHEDFERRIVKVNKEVESVGWHFVSRNRPYDQEKEVAGGAANVEPDVEAARRSRLIVYAILLLVPAINMSGMTESRLRRRKEEIGVRRAFGARRSTLMMQLFGENLLITIVAGLIGWLLSIAFAILFSGNLFTHGFDAAADIAPRIELGMLVQPSTFGMALLFCFLLNLLSSGIPAWRASRTNIVNALNKKS